MRQMKIFKHSFLSAATKIYFLVRFWFRVFPSAISRDEISSELRFVEHLELSQKSIETLHCRRIPVDYISL